MVADQIQIVNQSHYLNTKHTFQYDECPNLLFTSFYSAVSIIMPRILYSNYAKATTDLTVTKFDLPLKITLTEEIIYILMAR